MTSVAIRNYFFGRHQASNVAEISISKLHLFNRYQYNTAIWKCHISTILRSEFDLWWCQIKGDLERIKLEIFSLEQLQTRVAECTLVAPSPIKINVSFIWTFLLCNPNKNQILTRRAQVSDQIILRSLTWASIALCNLCCEVDGSMLYRALGPQAAVELWSLQKSLQQRRMATECDLLTVSVL